MKIVLYFLLITAIVRTVNAQQAPESSGAKSQAQAMIYVVGKVRTPAAIPFGKSINLFQAIRQAGGTTLPEKQSRALIIRAPAGCQFLTEITVNLRDILANRVKDVPLQPNDVIEVIPKKSKEKFPPSPRPCNPPKLTEAPPIYRYRF